MKEYKKLIENGASIICQTNSTITLQIKKRVRFWPLVGWTLLANLIGFIGYIVYVMFKKHEIKVFKK